MTQIENSFLEIVDRVVVIVQKRQVIVDDLIEYLVEQVCGSALARDRAAS